MWPGSEVSGVRGGRLSHDGRKPGRTRCAPCLHPHPGIAPQEVTHGRMPELRIVRTSLRRCYHHGARVSLIHSIMVNSRIPGLLTIGKSGKRGCGALPGDGVHGAMRVMRRRRLIEATEDWGTDLEGLDPGSLRTCERGGGVCGASTIPLPGMRAPCIWRVGGGVRWGAGPTQREVSIMVNSRFPDPLTIGKSGIGAWVKEEVLWADPDSPVGHALRGVVERRGLRRAGHAGCSILF